jgi:PhnB protein
MTSEKKAPIDEFRATIVPYLCTKNAADAIEFYKVAFGATESMRLADQTGKVMHAEIKIGDASIDISGEFPEIGVLSPQSLGGSPVMIVLHVKDVDAVSKQAVAAGATVLRPVEDQFHGNRNGVFLDPFGHKWMISTRIGEVSPEEIQRRARALLSKDKIP